MIFCILALCTFAGLTIARAIGINLFA
jgi:hypothetical protein